MFISRLTTREKTHKFDELTGILLQDEEHMKNFNLGSHSSDLALVAMGKQPYRGKPWKRNKGGKGKFHAKSHQGMRPPKIYANAKRNDACFYCGKFEHYSKDYLKRKYHESKHRNKRHIVNFVDATIGDDFKNIKLFVSNVALSAETNDVNA